jgi:electron transfer flavoprotein alpha subunit
LFEKGLFEEDQRQNIGRVQSPTNVSNRYPIAVVIEPGKRQLARELLGKAAEIAARRNANVVALVFDDSGSMDLASWGADEVARSMSNGLEEIASRLVADWALRTEPFCIIGPSTTWGREVMGRVAARMGAGLTGDAVELELTSDALTCWKPAFGGQLVAAVTSASPIQMVTVRPGILPILEPRIAAAEIVDLPVLDTGRVKIVKHEVNEDIGSLTSARRVVGLGLGVYPEEYPQVRAFCGYLGAELASTRKVTDRSWMARGTQIGITGLSIAPELYIAIGVSGSFNHMVGIRRAGTVVAINPDETAPVFDQSDIGIVYEWGTVAPYLIQSLVQLECERGNGALLR